MPTARLTIWQTVLRRQSANSRNSKPPDHLETFWEAVVEGVIDHLWLVPANPATAVALPPLSDTGTWSRAHCVVSVGEPACRPF